MIPSPTRRSHPQTSFVHRSWRRRSWLAACCFVALFAYKAFPDDSLWRFDYAYRHDRVTLEGSRARFAVAFANASISSREVGACLAHSGLRLETTGVEATDYPGLWLVESGDDPATTNTAIARLERNARLRFAAPVLEFGDPVAPTLVIPSDELILRVSRTLLPDAVSELRRKLLERQDLAWSNELTALGPTWILRANVSPRRIFALCDALQRVPGVDSATPNFIYHAHVHGDPTDPQFPNQWALDNIGQLSPSIPGADVGALDAWSITHGLDNIVVAVIDEGVDLEHADLFANLVPGYDATVGVGAPGDPPGQCEPYDPHGTLCAGLIGASTDNGVGMAGVAWHCKLLPIRIGSGSIWTQVSWVVDGLTHAVDSGADVLSNSWGSLPADPAIADAIDYALEVGREGHGCVVLFSAGNGGPILYPAAYDTTITVGATSPCDERKSLSSCDGDTSWTSSTGDELDLVAPGVLCVTTDIAGTSGEALGDYTIAFGGTSAACAHVAGAVALLLSVRPNLTHEEVREWLHATSADLVGVVGEDTPGRDAYMGYGRLDIANLLTSVLPLLPPTALNAQSAGSAITLEWQNPATYAYLILNCDGTDIAILPGDSTSYIDDSVTPGLHRYYLRGLDGLLTSPAQTVTVFHRGAATDLVWRPIAAIGAIDSGQALKRALKANGRAVALVDDVMAVPELTDFECLWVSLGTGDDAYTPNIYEIDRLIGYLETPGARRGLYIEGGNLWSLDTALNGYCKVSVLAPGISVSEIVGSSTPGCDLATVSYDYAGDAALVDRLTAVGSATAVLYDPPSGGDALVFNNAGNYRTLAANFEFGGLVESPTSTRANLIARLIGCALGAPGASRLICEDIAGTAGQSVSHFLRATTPLALEGYTLSLAFDPTLLTVDAVSVEDTVATAAEWSQATLGAGYWSFGVVYDIAVIDSLAPGYGLPIAKAEYTVSDTVAAGDHSALTIPESLPPAGPTIFVADSGTTIVHPIREYGRFEVVEPPTQVRMQDVVAPIDQDFVQYCTASFPLDVAGYALGIQYEADALEIVGMSLEGTAAEGAEIAIFESGAAATVSWATAQIWVDLQPPFVDAIAHGSDRRLLRIDYHLTDEASLGAEYTISPTAVVGEPPVATLLFDTEGLTLLPERLPGTVTVSDGVPFVRGDVNRDGLLDVGDPVTLLDGLYGSLPLRCADAADIDDDGTLEITDAISLLTYLFWGGSEPAAPFPAPGLDPTVDTLDCVD